VRRKAEEIGRDQDARHVVRIVLFEAQAREGLRAERHQLGFAERGFFCGDAVHVVVALISM
jgi:hypothetical protein